MSLRFEAGVVLAAAIAGAAAVGLGAFGAHGLRDALDERALATWRTAVDYQVWHALALLAAGCLAGARPSTALRVAAGAFVLGIALFSGSLYALALGAPRMLGAITPIGGAAFIIGWLALGLHAWRNTPARDDGMP